jgi:anti-anti-sigma factor
MAEHSYRLLDVNGQGDVLVLTITEPQVEGDPVAQELQRELMAAATAANARKVIIDFRNVRYISSVAFAPLLALRRHLNDCGGRLLLCGLSSMVGDIFYTTKMVSPTGTFTAPFEMQADLPAALAALREAPPAEPTPTSEPARGEA